MMKNAEISSNRIAVSEAQESAPLPFYPNCESGTCSDCYYFTTWQGDGWCDRYHQRILHSEREKDCFVR